ncbi:unnamed protein product [Rhizophagus irregularis]|nr:unnamed protein product [Rhizophagus irregularis]
MKRLLRKEMQTNVLLLFQKVLELKCYLAYIHHCDDSVMQGKIVNKPCNVKMYKFILNDLQECRLCVGVHNHSPPPPERTPDNIKDNLQMMML